MEKLERIKQFLSDDDFSYVDGHRFVSGYGYADGDGFGSGFGDGSGDAEGYGYGAGYDAFYGYGYGDGTADGDGKGRGYGSGLGADVISLNGERVYQIDNVPTMIESVRGNFAKGCIILSNLAPRPCYIAKVGKYFAHGDTLRKAMADAKAKYNENRPIEERIADFNREFPDRDVKVEAARLFEWHHILTGSCLAGRKAFCEDRGIDYENGHYTVNEFIALTRESYGGWAIEEMGHTLP